MSFRRRLRVLRKKLLFRLINFWPPYLAAGVHVTTLSPERGFAEVRMKLHWWNKNYFGTHFGGSLYAMCDPFYALILTERLGSGFVVWDKSSSIRFRRPGRGTVHARFEVSDEEVERIREETIREGRSEPHFVCKVTDGDDQVIAEIEKIVHVKREKKKRK